nr:octapeptide-repeat protein T2-like [Lytechinus pictus]
MAEAMNIGEKLQQMADNEEVMTNSECLSIYTPNTSVSLLCRKGDDRKKRWRRDGIWGDYKTGRNKDEMERWRRGWRGKERGKERGGRREGERERGRETENLRGSQIEMERQRHGWIDLNRETDRNIDAETDDLERDKQRQRNKRQMETDTDRFRENQRKID